MAKLIVTVRGESEGLISTLPRGKGWELESEKYRTIGDMSVGTITIGFDGDELDGWTEAALNANDEVLY